MRPCGSVVSGSVLKQRRRVRRGKFISRVALGCRVVPRCIATLNFQPQTCQLQRKDSECTSISVFTPVWHGLGTHGGGWGKTQHDKNDKCGALQGGTVRVRASRSWARPAPRSEFFYWLGRAANRPMGPPGRKNYGRCDFPTPQGIFNNFL